MTRYHIISKNKHTGEKHTWLSLREKLQKFYPDADVELRDSDYVGDYLLVRKDDIEYLEVNINKNAFDGEADYENVSRNSFIFTFAENSPKEREIVKFYRLTPMQ